MNITRALAGRVVEHVTTNGELLVIRCTDGRELQISWADDRGARLRGKPVLEFAGTHIIAKAPEILHMRELRLPR